LAFSCISLGSVSAEFLGCGSSRRESRLRCLGFCSGAPGDKSCVAAFAVRFC